MDTFDRLVESFKTHGLGQEAAELAAKGRDFSTVSEAREAYRRNGAIVEAERQATDAQKTVASGQSAPLLSDARKLVESAAHASLKMRPDEAHAFATRLQERELPRRGTDGTARWLKTFAEGLSVRLQEAGTR